MAQNRTQSNCVLKTETEAPKSRLRFRRFMPILSESGRIRSIFSKFTSKRRGTSLLPPKSPSRNDRKYSFCPVSEPSQEEEVSISKEETEVLWENLRSVTVLGSGAFGRVDLVKDISTDKIYALKSISKVRVCSQPKYIEYLFNEKNALQNLNSEFVVSLHQTFNRPNRCCFLMEPILGGELYIHIQRSKKLSNIAARFYAASVVLAFEDFHSKNLVFRDLKPENLVLTEKGYVKFVDLGFVKKLRARTRTFSVVGTLAYIAPEIIEQEGHGRGSDFWSLGVLIYELLTRCTPFQSKTKEETLAKIVRVHYEFPKEFPQDAADLVHRLLQRKDIYRLGVLRGVEAIKSHKWFADFDWEALRNGTMEAPIIPNLSNKRGSISYSPMISPSSSHLQFPVFASDQRAFSGF